MNGFLLLIPLLLIRYAILGALGQQALARAAHFAPQVGHERAAFWVYQSATAAIFVCAPFLRVKTDAPWLPIGLAVYAAGLLLCLLSTLHFAKPDPGGVNRSGLYARSRNPMYVAYLVYLLGCVLLTRSIALLALLIAFQVSSHWIVLSEERWCEQRFGEAYIQYKRKVRRYL